MGYMCLYLCMCVCVVICLCVLCLSAFVLIYIRACVINTLTRSHFQISLQQPPHTLIHLQISRPFFPPFYSPSIFSFRKFPLPPPLPVDKSERSKAQNADITSASRSLIAQARWSMLVCLPGDAYSSEQ